jgi:hypothetical protein
MDEMNDDGDEVYGETDPNNTADGEAGQDAPAGDGLAGVPVDELPGWRAGAFGSGRGLLGLARAWDLVARPEDGSSAMPPFGADQTPIRAGDPRLLLAADPRSSSPTLASDGKQDYPMPRAYVPDGHGGVKLRPDIAAAHPKGPLDFRGMAQEIDWPATLVDLGRLIGYSAAGAAAFDRMNRAGADPSPRQLGGGLLGIGADVWKAQQDANRDPRRPPQGADRVTNGLP